MPAAAATGQDPVAAAEREWTTAWKFDREDREAEHQYVLGGVRSWPSCSSSPRVRTSRGRRLGRDESSRLGRLALRLWAGLLDREQVSAR